MCKKLQKCLFLLAASSMVFQTASCIPSRSQINAMISSSILNGIGLAITFGVEAAFSNFTGGSSGSTN